MCYKRRNIEGGVVHWIEKHGIEVRQDDWLIMVISQYPSNMV